MKLLQDILDAFSKEARLNEFTRMQENLLVSTQIVLPKQEPGCNKTN